MIKHLQCKYKIVLCLLFVLFDYGIEAQVVSVKQSNITVENLLDSLTSIANVDIAYDVNALPTDSVIHVDYENTHALEIIKDVLSNANVNIKYINGQIVISADVISKVEQNTIVIRGLVKDEETEVPLPLVNVSVEGKPLGTISNSEGLYEFKVPSNYRHQKMAFSFLGYHTAFVQIPERDSTLNIQLQQTSVKLDEVEIAYKDPDEIMEFVNINHSDNYNDEQAILSGFFRESIKQDGEYVQVSEAIVEIIKPSYYNPSNLERVKFIKGRKKNDLQSMDMVNFKLEGGPFQFSRVDIARYQDFFAKENGLYKFSYDGVDVLNDELVYKVRFKPHIDNGDLLYQGVLFIHSESYALVRAHFSLTKKALKTSGRVLIKKASRKIKVKPLMASYYIDYREYNGKWILNRVDGEMVIRINDKNQKVNSEFSAISELLISNWGINKEVKVKASELYKSKYILADQITETDNVFWEDYNIIRPEEELEKVFKETKVVSK